MSWYSLQIRSVSVVFTPLGKYCNTWQNHLYTPGTRQLLFFLALLGRRAHRTRGIVLRVLLYQYDCVPRYTGSKQQAASLCKFKCG